MKVPSSSPESRSAHRLVVAVAVATAAAAVIAGVVLNEARHAPFAESASPTTAAPPDAAGAHWDPALPPAGTSGTIVDRSPTF